MARAAWRRRGSRWSWPGVRWRRSFPLLQLRWCAATVAGGVGGRRRPEAGWWIDLGPYGPGGPELLHPARLQCGNDGLRCPHHVGAGAAAPGMAAAASSFSAGGGQRDVVDQGIPCLAE